MPTGYSYSFRQLASFNGINGSEPSGSLTLDAAGNVFGTTQGDNGRNFGNVFELPHTSAGYAATPVVLSYLDTAGVQIPMGGVTIDAAGNLLGTAAFGPGSSNGAVFELPNARPGFGPATPIATFDYATTGESPRSKLVADADGNLYGTTSDGGPQGGGTVFELKKTAGGYSATPLVLASFANAGPVGAIPAWGLYLDAEGNVFGTTGSGGANNVGTVFEIPKTASGFDAPIVPATFAGLAAPSSEAVLTADANGDLFGTLPSGGPGGFGTVYEIEKIGSSYGPVTPIATFDGTNGSEPVGGLVVDKQGDLIGTTNQGGSYGDGTIYELVKTGSGYSAPVTMVSFNGASGRGSVAGLTMDAAGNLFGTTEAGGADDKGTVFELQLNTSTFQAAIGTASASGTAVVFSGVALDPLSTVSVYEGVSSSETLLGTPTLNADGSWSLPTTLADGSYESFHIVVTDSTGRTVDVPATFKIQTGITGQYYVSKLVTYDAGGQLTGFTAYDAAASVKAVLTYASDRSFSISHPVTGEPYTSLTNNYAVDGTQTGFTLSGFTGLPYTSTTDTFEPGSHNTEYKTLYRADGSTYAVQTRTPDGGIAILHPGVTGQTYTAYTNYYGPSQDLLGASYAGYTGAYNIKDASYVNGIRVSQAALLDGGRLVAMRYFNADGSLKSTTSYAVPDGQTVANTDLILKSGTTDEWDCYAFLDNSGTVDIESGSLILQRGCTNANTIDVGAHSSVSFFGLFMGDGTVTLHGAGSQVNVTGTTSNSFTFTDTADATLALDNPSNFAAQIKGFAGQNVVDVQGFGASATLTYQPNASDTAGTLTVAEAGEHVSLNFVGNYRQSDFAAVSANADNSGILIRHA